MFIFVQRRGVAVAGFAVMLFVIFFGYGFLRHEQRQLDKDRVIAKDFPRAQPFTQELLWQNYYGDLPLYLSARYMGAPDQRMIGELAGHGFHHSVIRRGRDNKPLWAGAASASIPCNDLGIEALIDADWMISIPWCPNLAGKIIWIGRPLIANGPPWPKNALAGSGG